MKDFGVPLLILCGGRGSRLGALVKDTPKPLLVFNGKPFLEKILDDWYSLGQRNFVLVAGFMGTKVENFGRDWAKRNQDAIVKTIIEKEPLGTGGGIKNSLDVLNLSGRVLISNADTLCPIPRLKLLSCSQNSLTTIKLASGNRYGKLIVKGNKVISFSEKDKKKERNFLINSGIYNLDTKAIKKFEKVNFSLELDFLPKLVKEKNLYAIFTQGKFLDIGTLNDFYKLKDEQDKW